MKMENLHNKEAEDNYKFILKLIGSIGFAAIVIVTAVFFLHIVINETFTVDQKNIWVAFGEYFGGILSPTLAFAALIALLYSIHHQIIQFNKSTAALNEQNQLLKDQIQEARNLELSEGEIKKIDATNEYLIEAISSLTRLISIKRHYYEKLTGHPAQRAAVIPPIVTSMKESNFQISRLVFLGNKLVFSDNNPRSILILNEALESHNTILEMLKMRNDLHSHITQNPLNIDLMLEFPHADDITSAFFKKAGIIPGVKLIHITEELIKYIDGTIIHLLHIIQELPDIAESRIKYYVPDKYSKVVRYNLSQVQLNVIYYVKQIDQNLYQQFLNKQYIA